MCLEHSCLEKFCDIIVDRAKDHLSIVKMQAAYFERFGPKGMMILDGINKSFQSRGTLTLIDAKSKKLEYHT